MRETPSILLFRSAAAILPSDGDLPARKYDYQRLMQVSLANTYYKTPHACPDFAVAATPHTLELMTNIGLLLRVEPTGFSVLYDANRQRSLLAYLQQQQLQQRTPFFPPRLSFTLRLRQPSFENYTRLPPDFASTDQNFYFCNSNAHWRGERALLTRGRFVRAGELLPVVPVQLPVPVDDSVDRVEVRDMIDEVVLCVPRCVPAELSAKMTPDDIDCRSLAAFLSEQSLPPGVPVCHETIYLDFSSLPDGFYTVCIVQNDGSAQEAPVLYTSAFQYAFVDLLFSNPEPDIPIGSGVYPVSDLSGPLPTVTPVHYEIAFRRRNTYWRYYVVMPPRARTLGGLSIQTEPPGAVTFRGPEPVTIATATPALRFVSERPVPMTQTPPARFILNSDDGVLMQSMPVASTDQILPCFCLSAYSDIYVNV